MTNEEFCRKLCELSNSLNGCNHIKQMGLLNEIRAAFNRSETRDDSIRMYKRTIRKGLDYLTDLLSAKIKSLDGSGESHIDFPIWFEDSLEITDLGYGLYAVIYTDKDDGPQVAQILDKYEVLHFYRQKMKDLLHCQGKASPKIATLEKGFL